MNTSPSLKMSLSSNCAIFPTCTLSIPPPLGVTAHAQYVSLRMRDYQKKRAELDSAAARPRGECGEAGGRGI